MTLALSLFVLFYILMLVVQQYRPWVALGGAGAFLLLGKLGVYDFTLADAARAVDFNVLLMMAGTMGTVSLFIESRMPARLAELLIVRVPNVKWAVCMLALFAGVISAFVDNVATVLMVAPVGLAIARKLKISPVPVLISIAVSSNLQGAATLVGDTTSILLGGFAEMNFFHFFWMEGRPGIFFGVELGALASLGVLLFTFRHETQPISATVETEVTDTVPSALMLLTVGLLIAASFLPQPAGGLPLALYSLRSGLICAGVCLFGILRACLRTVGLRALRVGRDAVSFRDSVLLRHRLPPSRRGRRRPPPRPDPPRRRSHSRRPPAGRGRQDVPAPASARRQARAPRPVPAAAEDIPATHGKAARSRSPRDPHRCGIRRSVRSGARRRSFCPASRLASPRHGIQPVVLPAVKAVHCLFEHALPVS